MKRKRIALFVSRREHSFSEEQLLYLEQRNHTVVIHLADGGTLSCSGRLDNDSDSLLPPVFYRCYKSYLVNLSNVAQLNHKLKVFVMKDGSNVYISRGNPRVAGMRQDSFLFEQRRKDL